MTSHKLCAEDLVVGREIDLGSYVTTSKEIIAFATQWDPQPFHTDPVAAASGYFGGIVASGAHTLSIFQRLAVLGAFQHWDIVAGRAIRNVQLLRPVRPGDELHGILTVADISYNRPDRALVQKHGQLVIEGAVAMTVEVEAYVRMRHPNGSV
ncbi:acyl dehydratase [Marmoricola sp. URHA0025 HA25]